MPRRFYHTLCCRTSALWLCCSVWLLLMLPALADSQATARPPTSGLEKVTLQLKWRHQFQFAGYYAAVAQGYYAEAGLDVHLREAEMEMDLVEEVVSGRAQFGVGTSELAIQYAEGQPLVMLAPIFQHSPLVLIVRADADLNSIHDLPGHKLMIESQSAQLFAYFLNAGLSLENLQIEPHIFGTAKLLSGEISGLSAYSTDEPYLLEQAGLAHHIFTPRSHGLDFYGDTLFSSAAELKNHPERVAAFVAASLKGWAYALEHPEEIVELIFTQYSQRHSREHLRYEAERTFQLIRPDLVEIGYSNPGRWEHIIQTYQRYGMMPESVELAGFFYQPEPEHPALLWLYTLVLVLGGLALVLACILWPIFRLNRRLRQEVYERQQVEARLLQAKTETERANLAKRDFLANMSHEIRTPINGIMGMLALLKQTRLSAEQRNYAEVAQSSADLLLKLIGDVLDFSRIEAGKLELAKRDFSLHEALEDVVEMLALKAHEKGLTLTCLLSEPTPIRLHGDPERLQQILLNLMGNAIKFTAQGEVTLRVKLLREGEQNLKLSAWVEDTGVGLSENIDKLFLPFEQQDASTHRDYGGTGLGLAISSQLVAMMQGQIGAFNRPEQGACFWFEIRLELASEPLGAAQPVLVQQQVMLARLQPRQAEMLQTLLASWQVQAQSCQDPEALLAWLQALPSANGLLPVLMLEAQLLADSAWMQQIQQAQWQGRFRGVCLAPVGQIESLDQIQAAGFETLLQPVRQQALLRVLNPASAEPSQATEAASAAPWFQTAPRLLLVEDNVINQAVALAILEQWGCQVETAEHGESALACLAETVYDLVLMDIQMPIMDGFETIKLLRAQPRLKALPVVATTANALKEDRETCLAAGFSDYLSKPFLPDDLQAVLQRWLPTASVSDQ